MGKKWTELQEQVGYQKQKPLANVLLESQRADR